MSEVEAVKLILEFYLFFFLCGGKDPFFWKAREQYYTQGMGDGISTNRLKRCPKKICKKVGLRLGER